MKNKYLFPILLAVLSFSGCQSPTVSPPEQPERTSAIIDADAEDVWSALVQDIGTNYPIQTIDKGSGLIVTDNFTVPVEFNNMLQGKYIYPPKIIFATWAGLRCKMTIIVRDLEAEGTQVVIRADYQTKEVNVTKSWLAAESTGAEENRILSRVELALSQNS